jgi:hypothetical protein
MTAADIVAYIGAAAWAPQIVTWIYRAVSKPRLTIVSAGTVEVGFSMFGPIVNATLAISSERRDALIEKITLQITHEHGEKRLLVWRMLNENQQQIRDPQGNISSQYKNNPAVALKVSTLALTEKTIGFHDPNFESMERVRAAGIVEQFRHLEGIGGNAAALDQLLSSIEFERARREFESYMYWRAGEYEFSFSAQLAGVKNPHVQRFAVTFVEGDIETLRKNFELLTRYTRAILSTNAEDQKLITWNWVYPAVTAISASN